MTTLMKSKVFRFVAIEDELVRRGVFIFTSQIFRRIFKTSPGRTKTILENYTKGGLFLRLKQGLYCLKRRFPADEEIANALYKPSYLSFEYVLAKHGIIPEIVYSITSATTKPTREFTVKERAFSYYKIKKEAFTGYAPAKVGENNVLIAEPEKALVDYLYFVSLGKRSWNDRFNFSGLNKSKIIQYAKLFKRPGLMELIKKI
jgi:predicted transcriptional regulator of viral defense system